MRKRQHRFAYLWGVEPEQESILLGLMANDQWRLLCCDADRVALARSIVDNAAAARQLCEIAYDKLGCSFMPDDYYFDRLVALLSGELT